MLDFLLLIQDFDTITAIAEPKQAWIPLLMAGISAASSIAGGVSAAKAAEEQALRAAEAIERALTVQLRDELPENIITRDAEGNPLSDEEFRKANVMGFHGTRNATARIYEQGSVASMREGDIVSVEDAAFFHGDAPLPAKTFGQTIIPSRIDTREFVTVDMGGNSYMEDPLKGTYVTPLLRLKFWAKKLKRIGFQQDCLLTKKARGNLQTVLLQI